jgi:PAS domain-containing protein
MALGWAARAALTPLWGPTGSAFIFFYPAIVVTAWYGRRGPALLAIALSTLTADWFFIEPRNSFWLHHPSEAVALVAFVIVDLILVGAIELMHGARERLARELAQRLKAEAQLSTEKELLATTLASIGDAVIVTDEKGMVSSLNAEAERLTGWRSDEASGKSLTEVFPNRE